MTVVLAQSLYFDYKTPSEELPPRSMALIAIILSLGIYCGFTLANYDVPVFWLDEYTQMMHSQLDPIIGGSREQQPPGAYILSKALISLVGFNELTARLTGFIPMLFALYLFLLFGSRVGNIYIFSILFTGFFILDPDVRYLSLEGRGVGLGLAAAGVVLVNLTEELKQPTKNGWIKLSGASYVFLTSIGLQAPLILGVLAVALFLNFLISRKKSYLMLFLGLVISVVIYFPIQWEIIKVAREFSKFHSNISDNFLSVVNQMNWNSLLYFIPRGNLDIFWAFYFIVVSCVFGVSVFRSKNKELYFIPFVFFIVFIPIFHIVFHTFVNWHLQRWYFLIFLIVCMGLMTALLSRFFSRSRWGYVAALIVLVFNIGTSNSNEIYHKNYNLRSNWKKLYQTLDQPKKEQRVYVLGSCNVKVMWCFNFFVGAELYNKNKNTLRGLISKRSESEDFSDNGMIYDMDDLQKKVMTIVIVDREGVYNSKLQLATNKRYEIFRVDDFWVIRTTHAVVLKEEIPKILQWIIQHSPEDPSTYYPYELLAWYYLNLGKQDMAGYWLKARLERPQFNKTVRHDLAKKIAFKIAEISAKGSEKK